MSVMRQGELLVAVALAAAAGDWVAVARGSKRAGYTLKPLVPAVLIAAALALDADDSGVRLGATLLALAFSLAGDVFLMLPRDLFLPGLGSFLVAHLAYVVAFNTTPPPLGPAVAALVAVGILAAVVYAFLLRGMRRAGRTRYAAPVALYAMAIVAMAASAFTTVARPRWSAGDAALAVAGATLFMFSDGLIGWNRFVRALRWAPLAIIVTYNLAQASLVLALLA